MQAHVTNEVPDHAALQSRWSIPEPDLAEMAPSHSTRLGIHTCMLAVLTHVKTDWKAERRRDAGTCCVQGQLADGTSNGIDAQVA